MIDELQAHSRKGLIGSSDAAAICGVDPYRTAYDVWASMTGRLESRFQGNDATELGNYLEPSLITYAARTIGVPVERNVMYRAADGRRIANVDAIVLDSGFSPMVIEAKTSGILSGGFGVSDQWGDPFEGFDGVPETHLIQTHFAVDVAAEWVDGLNQIAIVALIGGRGFLLYQFEASDALRRAIRARVDEFWDQCILKDTPPVDSGPSREVARAIRRVPDKLVEVDADIIKRWREKADAAKAANDELEAAKAEVLARLGDAEAAYSAAGGATFYKSEYSESIRKAYSARTLRFSKKLTAPGSAQKRESK